MSAAIPIWLQVVMWLVALVVAVVAAGLQVKGEHPAAARRLFVLAGILFIVAFELTLINLAKVLDVGVPIAVLAQLLALSVSANIWMFINSRRAEKERRRTQRESATVRSALREAEQAREELEQRSWTDSGLDCRDCPVPPSRKGDRYGMEVSVRSEVPLKEPIRLRFWFNEEVQDPRVGFTPDAQDSRPRPSSRVVLPEEAKVYPGGRVDVRWGADFHFYGGDELRDVLHGAAQLKLTVYAVSPETPLEVRSVERPVKLS